MREAEGREKRRRKAETKRAWEREGRGDEVKRKNETVRVEAMGSCGNGSVRRSCGNVKVRSREVG